MNDLFRRFSHMVSNAVGSPWAFVLAVTAIIAWATTGPIFGYSDTWQLVVNTATTIVTFLMVFLIQNTQNRDARAIHLKLDELIRGLDGARSSLVDLEDMTDEELDKLQHEFERVRRRYRTKMDEQSQEAEDQQEEPAPQGTATLQPSGSQRQDRPGNGHGQAV